MKIIYINFLLLLNFNGILAQLPSDTCLNNRFNPTLNIFTFSNTSTLDITYGVNSITNVARVYSPIGDTNNCRPAVIWAHGGGFTSGSYLDQKTTDMMTQLARKGYVGITMRYRLWPSTPANALEYNEAMIRGLQDMIAAVRYVKANATTLGIDSSQVFIGGSSAGAIIANHVAYMDQNEANATALANQGGNYDVSTIASYINIPFNVAGCVTHAGSLWNLAWLTGETTPWGAVHNSSDPTVPYNSGGGSAQIYTQLQTQNIKSFLKTTYNPGLHTPFPLSPSAAYVDTFNLSSYTQLFNLLKHHNTSTISVSGNTLTVNPTGISYQWFLNGIAIPSATLQNHLAVESGNYHVQTQNCATCFSSSNLLIFNITTTAVNELGSSDQRVLIYPQPTNNFINIASPETIKNVSIYSIDGKMLSSYLINKKDVEINISLLQPAIYFLIIEFEDNSWKYQRIIKN